MEQRALEKLLMFAVSISLAVTVAVGGAIYVKSAFDKATASFTQAVAQK